MPLPLFLFYVLLEAQTAISPLYDTPLMWVLGGIFFIIGWVLIALYGLKGFTHTATAEIKNLNATMSQYLIERKEHDEETTRKIETIGAKVDDLKDKVTAIKASHDIFTNKGTINPHMVP